MPETPPACVHGCFGGGTAPARGSFDRRCPGNVTTDDVTTQEFFKSIKTSGLAALALALAMTGTALADRAPTPDELTKIEAVLKKEGFTKWKRIEVEDDEVEVDNAIDAAGKQFDLELDPKTFAITKREAE